MGKRIDEQPPTPDTWYTTTMPEVDLKVAQSDGTPGIRVQLFSRSDRKFDLRHGSQNWSMEGRGTLVLTISQARQLHFRTLPSGGWVEFDLGEVSATSLGTLGAVGNDTMARRANPRAPAIGPPQPTTAMPTDVTRRLEAVERELEALGDLRAEVGALREWRQDAADPHGVGRNALRDLWRRGKIAQDLLRDIYGVRSALGKAKRFIEQLAALQQQYDERLKPLEGTMYALRELSRARIADRGPQIVAAAQALEDIAAAATEHAASIFALRAGVQKTSSHIDDALQAIAKTGAQASDHADRVGDMVVKARSQSEELSRELHALGASDTTLMELQYQEAVSLWTSVANEVRTTTLTGATPSDTAGLSGGVPDAQASLCTVEQVLRELRDASPDRHRSDLAAKLEAVDRLRRMVDGAPGFDAQVLSSPQTYQTDYAKALVDSTRELDPSGLPEHEAGKIATIGYRPMLASEGAEGLAAYVAKLHRWERGRNLADWREQVSQELVDIARVVMRLEGTWHFDSGRGEPHLDATFSALAETVLDAAGLERVPIAIGDRASAIDHEITSSDADPHETDLEVASIRMHGLREKADTTSIIMKPTVAVRARGTGGG